MKKILSVALVVIMAGCHTGCAVRQATGAGGTVMTGSNCYPADIAAKAGLTQEETAQAEAVGRQVFWANVGNTSFGRVDCVKAYYAYEAEVARLAALH